MGNDCLETWNICDDWNQNIKWSIKYVYMYRRGGRLHAKKENKCWGMPLYFSKIVTNIQYKGYF